MIGYDGQNFSLVQLSAFVHPVFHFNSHGGQLGTNTNDEPVSRHMS